MPKSIYKVVRTYCCFGTCHGSFRTKAAFEKHRARCTWPDAGMPEYCTVITSAPRTSVPRKSRASCPSPAVSRHVQSVVCDGLLSGSDRRQYKQTPAVTTRTQAQEQAVDEVAQPEPVSQPTSNSTFSRRNIPLGNAGPLASTSSSS